MHDSERCSIYGTRVTESQLMIASLSRSCSQKQLQSDNGQGNQGKSHYGNIVGSHRRERHMKSEDGFAGVSMEDFIWQPCVVWGRPAGRTVAK
jgi:hypothetical protein